jgi:phenylacetate-CoA ligase
MLLFLHRYVLLPAFEGGLKRRRVFRYWKELERSQWLPAGELERLQFERLQRLLRETYTHCPYYRETWGRHGLDPNRLQAPGEFQRWPVIDREMVRTNRLSMRSQAPGIRLLAKSTGGSTGVPLHFDFDWESNDRRFAAWHRGYSWAGAGPGTKQFYFWGGRLGEQATWQRWKDRLYNRLYRRLVVSSFDFREDQAAQLLTRFNRYRPDVLVAYTNPLYVWARVMAERGMQPYRPRAIVVGAEKLHGFQRTLMERVFQAPVFETYGTREFMLLGAECERHQGLHLTMENILLEVLDDQGRPTPSGEEGNVVVTDLTNQGMPFIRYASGDRAVAGWGVCSCGRGLPLLKKVVGRRLDVLRTPDGRLLAGEFFPHLLKDFPAVRQFQVVQQALDRVQLRVVLAGSWGEVDWNRLNQEVSKVLGPAVRLELLPVNEIPLTGAGKFRVVVGLESARSAPNTLAEAE